MLRGMPDPSMEPQQDEAAPDEAKRVAQIRETLERARKELDERMAERHAGGHRGKDLTDGEQRLERLVTDLETQLGLRTLVEEAEKNEDEKAA